MMGRAARLLQLMQILRRHRYPVSGAVLAAELGVSLRSLYRDIATLQESGAAIDGAPGLGYVLRPGFMLPPLMLGADEIDALVLGMRWVAERGDPHLAAGARDVLAKIRAVLPPELQAQSDDATLIVGPGPDSAPGEDMAALRQAIRLQRKVRMHYRDGRGERSERVLWPLALGYFEQVQVLVGWCELRGAFRHFRADRIDNLTVLSERYPGSRRSLIRQWREEQGIAPREGVGGV